MYVCVCNAVTESTIRELVTDGCTTLGELQARTGCADCCGTCHDHVLELIDRTLEHSAPLPHPAAIRLPLVA